jgi:diaminohydroxyphosphoribosylaminopyrimidine deaminase/5-amino-6-(5-phosphoribosylamino)uracil reductase
LELLREGGVSVKEGLLEAEGSAFSRMRNCFVSKNRPYILLKFARSADGYLGQEGRQVWLTDAVSRRLVHKWRSETDAILIGAQTARTDDPELTNRLYFGKSPLRLVIDPRGSLPHSLRVFDGKALTWVFTGRPEAFEELAGRVTVIQAPVGPDLIPFLLAYLAEAKITSLLVEGGASLLGQFIDGGFWDEARVLEAPVHLDQGIPAPLLPGPPRQTGMVCNDRLLVWYNR